MINDVGVQEKIKFKYTKEKYDMFNTIKKIDYIKIHIVWECIAFLWCKNIFFRCIPNCTYIESLIILIIIIIISSLISIKVTWISGRNYVNLFQNIVISWGIFVFCAYLDVYKSKLLILAAITLLVTLFMVMLILFRKIRHTDNKERIIKKRIKRSMQCVRRNLSIAMFGVLVPLGMTVIINGTILNSNMEVIKVYGDEHCLDANIEVISYIDPERWKNLNVQERLNVCQTILNCEARHLGLSHEILVGTQELDSGTLGYYSEAQHLVVIDLNHLKSDMSYEVLKTIIHEATHAYQHEQVALYRTLDDRTRNLLMFYDVSIYAEEFANYQDGKDDYWQYYGQKIESDARKNAEIDSLEYIERVNEYLGK